MALPAQSTRSWVVHLQGRTLVEGIAEGFRHPNPMCPDPIAKLSQIRDVSWEKLCSVFMDRTYPEESGFSPDERDRMRVAFRRRFFDGRRDAHSQFRREIAELQTISSDEAMQMCAVASARATLHLLFC